MISRRTLLGAMVTARSVAAQPGPRAARLAIMAVASSSVDAFRRAGLGELASAGWIENQNLDVLTYVGQGGAVDLDALARSLALARPDVAVAVSNPVAHAIRAAAPQTPIVMAFAGNDPTMDRLAATLARPGGLVTGVVMFADELNVKRLEVAREAFPAQALGYLAAGNIAPERIALVSREALRLGVDLTVAGSAGETLEASFATLRANGAKAVVVASSPALAGQAAMIAETAAAARLPTICEWRSMAEAGCLMSYGADGDDLRRKAARHVVRILRGEKPGEIPMERPARFEFVVNLKTANSLGVELPASVLARADEVIE